MRASLLLLVAAAAGCGRGPTAEEPAAAGGSRNILLISIDTLRADRVGAYGYPRDTTPSLDRLAARGVRFADVIAQSTWTVPSHRSLFFSTYPSVLRRGAADRLNLTEHLQAQGYETAAFVDGGYMRGRFGHEQGFGLYEDRFAAPAPEGGRLVADRRGGGFEAILPAALDWLRGRSGRPFFLFLHTYDVHCPYEPPEEVAARFTGGRSAPLDVSGMCGQSDFRDREVSPEAVRWIGDLYDAGLRAADDRLGAFLDELQTLGLAESTLIVVVSDHGESLGEQEWFGHNRLHPPQLFVPWVMAGPGLPAGVVVEKPAQLIDVAPTVLDWAGLPPLERAAGISLLPVLRGGETISAERLRVSEIKQARALLRGPWLLVQRLEDGVPRRLHRLDAASARPRNLLGRQPEVAASILAEWSQLAAALGVEAGVLDDVEADLPDELREELRALGYLE